MALIGSRRSLYALLVLATAFLSSTCGGRSDFDEGSSCRTPDQFVDSDGEIVECRVVQVVACETTDGGTVLCPESPRKSRRQFQLNPTTMTGFACLS
jgi:hypothetical protein